MCVPAKSKQLFTHPRYLEISKIVSTASVHPFIKNITSQDSSQNCNIKLLSFEKFVYIKLVQWLIFKRHNYSSNFETDHTISRRIITNCENNNLNHKNN